MRPNKALATVVLMLAQKGLAAAGIVDASEVTKCREAVARLIADVGVTALTWESGIGAYLGVTGGLLDAKEAFSSCTQTQP